MSDIGYMSEPGLPPPCPVCAGQTALKDMRKLSAIDDSVTFFFACLPCALEYPVAVKETDARFAGLRDGAAAGGKGRPQ